MKRLVERAHDYLLLQSAPLLMGDVCEALGITRGMSGTLRRKLARHLGSELVEAVRGTQHFYHVKGAHLVARGFKPPADLWRGWFNPATGHTGEVLGL